MQPKTKYRVMAWTRCGQVLGFQVVDTVNGMTWIHSEFIVGDRFLTVTQAREAATKRCIAANSESDPKKAYRIANVPAI